MSAAVYFIGPSLTLVFALLGFAGMWGAYGQRIKDLEAANSGLKSEIVSIKESLAKKLDKDALDEVRRNLDHAIQAINTRFDDLRSLILMQQSRHE